MHSSGTPKIRGWVFDVYPSNIGEMAVWIISENGQRIRLTDKFQPKIYVSGKKEDQKNWSEKSIQTQILQIGILSINSLTQRILKNQEY